MIFIQPLCFCIISSKAWFWGSFAQALMTPWNCIPSDLDAGNILSCHVLFISFMFSILFVVPLQLFFTDEVVTISSSSFSLAFLFSPCFLVAKVLPWLSLIQPPITISFSSSSSSWFSFSSPCSPASFNFDCDLVCSVHATEKEYEKNKQRPIRWLNALLYVAKYVIRPVYWLSKKRQDSSNLQPRVTAYP